VEPLMGRLVLPWFGGSAAVWTVVVLFFQVTLVLGYLYAHLLVRYVPPRRQMLVHVPVLLATLLVLPILPDASWKPTGNHDPTLRILGLLIVTIGPPFFALSTTGPLLQAWYARGPGQPYRFYALSNTGSLLGLLSYPLLVEPRVGVHSQAYAWSVAYGVFVALGIVIAVGASRAAPASVAAETTPEATKARAGWSARVLWLALAAIPSLLFLSVTNQLTQNVAPIPLLWVLPLAIYLLSLIICFEGARWYRRWLFVPLLPIALGVMAYNLFPVETEIGIVAQIVIFSLALFVCCMVCHGELARRKPPTSQLTSFYLIVAAGGALGGVFVAVVAPQLFAGYFELPLGLVLCAVVVSAALASVWLRRFPGGVGMWAGRAVTVIAAILTVVLGVYALEKELKHEENTRLMVRNFYGALRVTEVGSGVSTAEGGVGLAHRALYSGTISHGEQFLAPTLAPRPTAYYGPHSGIGILLGSAGDSPPARIGVIGLGTGTLATYGRPGDFYEFYEINPLDIKIAQTQFTFLRDSKAHVAIVPGDARLSLERQPDQHFNVLAVDAFTGDSIPVHLLTVQAFSLYFRNLTRHGILAIHITNRYLNLAPVVARAASALGKRAVLIESPGEPESLIDQAQWVLVPNNNQVALTLARVARDPFLGDRGGLLSGEGTRLWTDDYSDVLGALR
jgi:hypothetical protein